MDFVVLVTNGYKKCLSFLPPIAQKYSETTFQTSMFPCDLWQKLLIVFHFVNKNDTRKY
jgi:hypothetical protein